MQTYTFKDFFDSDFEPSDYAPNSSKLGIIAFWSFFGIIAIFGG